MNMMFCARLVVVALLGVIAGCIGAAVSQNLEAPAVDVADAQPSPMPSAKAPATAWAKGSAKAPAPAATTASAFASAWGSGRPMIAAALPPFPANSAAPRWQQYCVETYAHDLNMTLKRYGEAGWEYVGGDSYRPCFKRPAP
ncbi:MAG: hypothetical protein IPM79_04175 [Polyangiaceae bacterium]|nr:hypothetical protein [Polyangiaceae bacterium]